MTVTVDVQWALYGRPAGTAGFRVVSCSTGRLNRDNFSEAIGRFSPGTPDLLPQVTVSYVPSGAPDGDYVALAIHKFADGDREVRSYETGRQVVFTSYFCVPYLPLADAAIGYLPLYRALEPVRLPARGGGPARRIALTAAAATAATPAVGTLAKQVASLLLTGRPVCVLGANSTSMTERLRFIDTVMALLPYGYRARMTAATWVRPTHRDHRFRLFFSDAGRDHDPPDHVVWWNRPEQTVLTPAHGSAYEYQRFLEDEARHSTAPLFRQNDTHGFRRDELRNVLANLGIAEPEQAPDEGEPQDPPQPEPSAASQAHDPGEELLAECAAHARAPDLASLAADISRLRRFAASTALSDRQHARYRELIAEHSLLGHNPVLEPQAPRLYDALLPLAFGQPMTYEGYCQLEDCLGDPLGGPPDKVLLRAIRRGGLADTLVTAVVLSHLGEEQKLHKWFASSQFDAERLISLLAGKWEHPRHFRIVCDVMLDYLTVERARYDLAAVRRALRQHGFLAQSLLTSGCRDQYQVHALYRLLQAAYPDGLSRPAIRAILPSKPKSPVTPALFAVVLMLLARPEDTQLAKDIYATASLTGLALDPDTSKRILPLLPVLDQTSGSLLMTRMIQPETGSGGGPDDVPGPGT